MTDREKLAELLDDTVGYTLDETADHLLANGVVVREKGEWVKQWCETALIGHEYEDCPFCGCEILDTEKFWDAHFCPNCGADMRIEEQNRAREGENG